MESLLENCGAAVERMSWSPLLAAVAPIGGAVDVSMTQVKTMGTETGGIGGRNKVLAELSFQFLEEFKCSLDRKGI